VRALEQLRDPALGKLVALALEGEKAAEAGTVPVGPRPFWSWLRAVSAYHLARRHGAAAAEEPKFPLPMSAEDLGAAALAAAAILGYEESEKDEFGLAAIFAELAAGLVLGVTVTTSAEAETVH